MNRKITAIIALILACVCLFASCGANNSETDDTTLADTTTDTTQPDTTADSVTAKYPCMDMTEESLAPYIVLGDYKSIVVDISVYVEDEAVDKALAEIAKEYGYYTEITDRPTQKGDKLCIDFVGYIDGEAFEGGTAKGSFVELKENNGYIDGFDADLYGVEVGTKVSTKVTFPEDYHATDLAGVDAVFEITVNAIVDEYKFTDETVKEYTSGEFETLADYREHHRELMIIDNLDLYEVTLSTKICDAIQKISEITVLPEEQFETYKNILTDNHKATYEYYASAYEYYYGIKSYEEYVAAFGLTEQYISNEAKLWLIEDIIVIACGKDLGVTLSDADFYAALGPLVEEWGLASKDEAIQMYGESYLRNLVFKEMADHAIKAAVKVNSDYADYDHLYEKHADR